MCEGLRLPLAEFIRRLAVFANAYFHRLHEHAPRSSRNELSTAWSCLNINDVGHSVLLARRAMFGGNVVGEVARATCLVRLRANSMRVRVARNNESNSVHDSPGHRAQTFANHVFSSLQRAELA